MLKHSILLLLSFIALASAAFTPEKSFFVGPYVASALSNQLFQTRHGIIAYSVDFVGNGQFAPHYYQIDLEASNVTQILPELPTACGQGPSAFDRFIYHALTYSFVYYCTNNNSILLLDPENNFEVQKVFSLSINETFDEVRIITDGYSVAILGMSGILSQNPGPSHLIKFSLQNQQIVNHIVFDHGLAAGEFVTAYGTNGNFFVMTNIFNQTMNTNIENVYGMTLIGNSYTLTRLATFNSSSLYYTYTLPEFYIHKDLIFASNADSLVILDQNGNIQKIQQGVALRDSVPQQPILYRPVIVSYPGSGFLFVSLNNQTLLKISVVNQGFNVEDQGLAITVSLAIQDQLTDNLLFSISPDIYNFQVTNLDSGKVVYESVEGTTNFIITDKTYGYIASPIKIFDRETNELIQAITSANAYGYYDQKSFAYTFMNEDVITDQFNIQQIDMRTGDIYNLFSSNFTGMQYVKLVHATNDDKFDSPEFVIHMPSWTYDQFIIMSKTFGEVIFSVYNPTASFSSTLAVDYDTLDVFYFLSPYNNQTCYVTKYSYVSSSNSFVSTKTNQYPVQAGPSYIIPATDYGVILTTGNLTVIEMSSLNHTDYSIPTQYDYDISTFQNSSSSNGFKMIIAQGPSDGNHPAAMLDDNQIEQLPGSSNNTAQAGVGGLCSYWVVNHVGCFEVAQFYNICDNDIVSEIAA